LFTINVSAHFVSLDDYAHTIIKLKYYEYLNVRIRVHQAYIDD